MWKNAASRTHPEVFYKVTLSEPPCLVSSSFRSGSRECHSLSPRSGLDTIIEVGGVLKKVRSREQRQRPLSSRHVGEESLHSSGAWQHAPLLSQNTQATSDKTRCPTPVSTRTGHTGVTRLVSPHSIQIEAFLGRAADVHARAAQLIGDQHIHVKCAGQAFIGHFTEKCTLPSIGFRSFEPEG